MQQPSRLGRIPAGVPSWSFSRHRLLTACERAVFWRYYGSRGLGLEPNDPVARRAFALRWLTTLPLLVGTAVHTAARLLVESVVRGTRRPDYEELLEGARFTLNHVWRSSQPSAIDRFWRAPAIHPALREIVYRGTLRDGEIEEAKWALSACLASLSDAPVLDDLAEARDALGPEAIIPGFVGPELLQVEGALTWVALDVAYVHQSATVHDALVSGPCWCVADFKTGGAAPQPDEERLQLAAYALWLEARGLPKTEGIYLGRITDLRRGADRWYALGPRDLAAARKAITEDMRHQHALMADSDRGLPHPKERWSLAVDRRSCRSCNFAELCREELQPLRSRLRGAVSEMEGCA